MTVFRDLPRKCPPQATAVASATAVALGMFDGLHRGHMCVLGALTNNLDKTDSTEPSPPFGNIETPAHEGHGRCASGPRPVSPVVFTFSTDSERPDSKDFGRVLSVRSRDAILAGMGIEYVFEPDFSDFRDMPPEEFVKDFLCGYLNAKHIFCGGDFRFGKNAAGGVEDLKRLLPQPNQVNIVPPVCDGDGAISTTRIRKLIQSGDVLGASKLLGRMFTIDFAVEHGKHLGRELGTPTINQPFPENFVRPRFGVYASSAVVNGQKFVSVTNVGVSPTVGGGRLLAETYIGGFSGDLYGQHIPVELIEFIRDEQKFESIDVLVAQIKKNIAKAVNIVNALQDHPT